MQVFRPVACLGNITQDHLFFVDSFPSIDEVAYINRKVDCIGGRGAIVALVLSAIGVPTTLCTAVGGATPDEVFTFFSEYGLTSLGLEKDASQESLFEVFISVSAVEQNCVSFFLPKPITFQPSERQERLVREAGVVYFSTQKRAFNLHFLKLIDLQRATVIHNLSTYLVEDEQYRKMLLHRSHIIIGNFIEFSALLQLEQVTTTDQLFSRYKTIENIVVTLGEKGAHIYSREVGIQHIPALKAKPIAPVGVGDAFAAGIILACAARMPINVGAQIGAILAAESVQAATSYPPLDKLNTLIHPYFLGEQP